MVCVHVHHHFHPVGHGTFLTGVIHAGGQPFCWVYDCGSKRPRQISAALREIDGWPHWRADRLDLVVVSHFDNDHINGLEELIRDAYVERLALPYMSLQDRLAAAASLVGESDLSPSSTLFLLDPVRYLTSRGLSERVGRIMYVYGGRGEGVGDPTRSPEEARRPDGPIVDQLQQEYGAWWSWKARGGGADPGIELWSHQQAWLPTPFPIEFTFFNTALPGAVAKSSGASMQQIRQEVVGLVDLWDPDRRVRRGWRNRLKDCYRHHFGHSGPDRNDISLCLMVRPIPVDVSPCRFFDSERY